MENIHDHEAPEELTPSTTSSNLHWERYGKASLKTFLFLLVAALFGFIGGNTAPFFTDILKGKAEMFIGNTEKIPSGTSSKPGRQEAVSNDDQTIVSLVERNTPGVVSIVITKDVPKVRNFFQNPFFFDPFSQQRGSDNGSSGATEKQQIGSGSGFIVTADGLIITNRHVVSDTAAQYTVITNDGKEHSATVLARDPNKDIAVLKIEESNLPVLDLGDSDKVNVGQTVIAIGNPLGEFANSVTRGIISGVKREVNAGSGFGRDTEQLSGIFQTDAAINPGNSGGPLFNLSGEVIGVNVAMAQGAENIGFALPVNQVKRIIDQVKATGKISTPYMGVRYIILNDDIAKQNSLPINHGALVLRGEKMTDFAVIPGSPADKAGIVENDILLEVDGVALDETHQLANMLSEKNVGDEITLKVWHKGDTKTMKVKLEERK